MSEEQRLQALRERIDTIDEQILQLISARADCAQEVAEVKRAADPQAEFYRPEREAEVLRRILEHNPGPLGNEEMARLFREIMSACLALEQSLRVAYLGPEGTFTQAAVSKHFGQSVAAVPMGSINEVFREVEAKSCQFGVVPIENSSEGVVNHTLDCFLQSPLKICGEVELRIHQHLLSRLDDPRQIKRLYSHPQSLAQCREWLQTYLRDAEHITVSSNAEAARRASREEDSGAIAGEAAASLYQLNILQRNIEDNPENTTRFLIIGHLTARPSGKDKTTLLVSTRNRPGSLYHLLAAFAENNVSLSRIESRPSHCVNWEYVFFLDVEGHRDEPHIQAALAQLEASADLVKILGSYPKAVL
jgi:chorismate mutase/prephenate dehydratase